MGWMILITWLGRLILLLLVFMSIYGLSIILERRQFFKKNSLGKLKESLWFSLKKRDEKQCREVLSQHTSNPFISQIQEALDSSEDQLDGNVLLEKTKLTELEEGKLSLLATFGSTAPFIGLLGTVFGIIVAFGELSQGKVESNTIMLALAEALILTAVGLVVAIPSVVSFNHFNKLLKSDRRDVAVTIEVIRSMKKERK